MILLIPNGKISIDHTYDESFDYDVTNFAEKEEADEDFYNFILQKGNKEFQSFQTLSSGRFGGTIANGLIIYSLLKLYGNELLNLPHELNIVDEEMYIEFLYRHQGALLDIIEYSSLNLDVYIYFFIRFYFMKDLRSFQNLARKCRKHASGRKLLWYKDPIWISIVYLISIIRVVFQFFNKEKDD
eukprot:NODE_1038_length_2501_cov_0.332223.p2 type:complete len:185 gc:universal NODE_1038_length_2501_cov_0.332223:878-324(-)